MQKKMQKMYFKKRKNVKSTKIKKILGRQLLVQKNKIV